MALKLKLGQIVFVRVMDDLATTKNRWEVWAEIAPVASASNSSSRSWRKVDFIRSGGDRHQAPRRWEKARAGTVGIDLLRTLMTDPDPPEFVTSS